MLRLLAKVMAQLRHLQFYHIGQPDLTNSVDQNRKLDVTLTSLWNYPPKLTETNVEGKDQVYNFGPFDSSTAFMTARIPCEDLEDFEEARDVFRSIRKILDMI